MIAWQAFPYQGLNYCKRMIDFLGLSFAIMVRKEERKNVADSQEEQTVGYCWL